MATQDHRGDRQRHGREPPGAPGDRRRRFHRQAVPRGRAVPEDRRPTWGSSIVYAERAEPDADPGASAEFNVRRPGSACRRDRIDQMREAVHRGRTSDQLLAQIQEVEPLSRSPSWPEGCVRLGRAIRVPETPRPLRPGPVAPGRLARRHRRCPAERALTREIAPRGPPPRGGGFVMNPEDHSRGPVPTGQGVGGSPAGKAASILVVDDVSANLQVLTGIAQGPGVQGPAGPRAASWPCWRRRKRPAGPRSCSTSTCRRMDGLRGLPSTSRPTTSLKGHPRHLHQRPGPRTLDKVNAFAIGGVDYLTKPFQMEESCTPESRPT